MNPLMQFAAQILQNNQKMQESPIGQKFTQILRTEDEQAGVALANNLLQSYGLSKEEAVKQATAGLKQRGVRFPF